MFFKEKKVPSNREFVTEELEREWILSEENLMEDLYKFYMRNWKISCIIKRWETLRKDLWRYKREWFLKEVKREERKWNSCEIFYQIAK